MPLVKRKVSPVRLARRPSSWGTTDSEEVTLQGEYDLTAVTNVTLCGALRQLASLVTAAQDVSHELQEELGKISTRSSSLAARLAALEGRVAAHNPRAVPVPEGDLRSFSERRNHYHHTDHAAAELFTQSSRPPSLLSLYEKAIQTPVHIMREIDQLRDDGLRSSRYFLCEPVLGDSLKKEKLRKLNLDIETRRPASFVALREWCSDDETLTEVCLSPVSPSVPARVCPPEKEPAAHKLPSPEQRVLALSLKYPPELVPIDVSGTGFKRLEKFRQSLVHFEYYKGKHRRKRVKRRNTIADTRDVQIALADREAASTSSGRGRSSPRSGSPSSRGGVSFTDRSFDTTETLDTTSNTTKTSSERENHHPSLGVEVCVPALPRDAHTVSRRMARENTFRENELTDKEGAGSSGGNPAPVIGSRQALAPHISNINKNSKRDTTAERQRSHLPILTQSPAMNVAVKLREGTKDECIHSSSGNWSASSSTRTSVESDQHRPLASPTSSYEQDSIPSESLHVRSSSPSSNLRTNSRTTDDLPSTSSHTSDGTLTPTQDIQDIPFLDDDTGSAYSCDTEGYYTSFHIDSGIRSVSYEGNKLAESEYELFGKGSTGTTNSSASIGTVVMRNPEKKTPPKPPQRVSSLERKQENRESVITVIHVNGSTSSREDVAAEVPDKTSSQDGDSKSSRDGDSGRETSSSPTEPTSPRQPSLPSPEMECSESDLEADRQEILRVKTTINSSRIPSMCVITPPQSDDESVRSGNVPLSRESSGSQIDNQGQQAPPQGLLGSLVSQGQSHGVTAKMLSFQNSGAKSGGARNVGAISGGKSAVNDSASEKDSGGRVPVVSHSYTPTLTVIPRGKDGDINAHLKGIMHTAAVSAPSRPDPDQPVLIRPSLVKQAEREKRLSQESDDSQNTELQRQTSKEEKQKAQGEKGQVHSSELVSYKDLPPPTTTTAHPFSAVPSSVKQNVVITPTNSLERRKANPAKAGARVTLNSDGKVVYSSDSLPRRKGHSSFEPGPYIKPQVTSSSQTQAVGGTVSSTVPSTAHIKPSASGVSSSIQHTPLPPPPTSSANAEASTLPHPMAQRPQHPLPHSVTHVPSGPAGLSHSKQFLPVASQSTLSSSVTTTPSIPVSTHKPQSTSQHTTVSTSNSAQSSHQQTTLLSKIHSSSSSSSPQTHLPFSTQPHSVLPAGSHPVPLSQPHSVPSLQSHPTLTSQPHSVIPAQPLPLTSQPHLAPSAQLHPTLISHPHPVLPGQPHSVLPAQPQTILPSQTHQIPQAHPPLPQPSSQTHPSLPTQSHIATTQPHPILSQSHPVSSHPHPIQATQPHSVQSSQSLSTQLPASSQLLSNVSPQSVLLSSKQTASPHMPVKTQPKSDSLSSHQSNTVPGPSSVPIQASMTRTPQTLPQQRLQQATQQPQSPSNQKQTGFAGKGEDDLLLSDKQIPSVSGSTNSIYGTTQQQQLKQQQQQILQARQEAQMQLLQQQQQQIYQTRQEAQRVIQQQQLQQLQQQQLQKQQMLQQQHLQQQYLYQTKDEAQMQLQQQQIILQQPIYQTHQELQQARQQIPPPSQSQAQQLPQTVATSGGVIMASQGAPMSPRSQRAGAYVHVQGQVSAGTAPQQMVAASQTSQGSQSSSKSGQRSQNSQGYTPGDATSRAPTPVQGPITSSPHRGVQHSTEAFTHQHLRTDPGMLYGSQRSLQSVGLLPEGRGAGPAQQPPRPISTSPPPYSDHHHSLTDSDIYGRIGMTRHVQVGGTLPAGFGRHQRGYNSLPPSRRQSYVPQTVEEQQLFLQQQQQHQQLSRRSSVASYTAGMDSRDGQRPAASNPSTPEKVLDKKEKSSKKEKDKDKKKKEAKTEKSPKKKWFWTLPLRRKKKNKEESAEDDDGGFKAASEKGARKLMPRDDSSFIRYPSPDTASSDMNSSYSSEMSGEHSYRSSPSSEVYYYSQRAQQQTMHLHHQQQQQQQQQQQHQQHQQQQQKQQQQQGGGLGPRSLPTTPVSPPDNSQSSFVTVNSASQGVMSDVTDLTVTDLSRGRRYMSREELYAAMRHPQYYNYHRGTMTTHTSDYSGQKSTPTPSRSTSPAVFGVSPLPPYTVRPQAQNLYSAWPPDQRTNQQQIGSSLRDQPATQQMLSESHSEDTSPTADVEPPEAYQDLSTSEGLTLLESQGRLSPRKPPCGQESPQNQQNQQSQQNQQTLQAGQSTPKQTSRGDFKKMILNKSMSSAGGNHRISAVEMLKASRPGIYGYSPPPAPVVKPPQPSPSPSRGEGVIIPPSSRNTARALLFQTRFGSGRRFRTPKTEIISTTILEDHGGEVVEQEEEDDEEEEEEEDSSSDSPDHSSLQNVRGPLARAYSEPCASSNTKTTSPSSSPVDEIAHSTPNTTIEQLPQPPDVSLITPDSVPELLPSEKDKENDEKESMETAL